MNNSITGTAFVREVNDACTPLDAFSRFVSRPNVFFLDSALSVNGISRYSFLGFNPFLVMKAKGRRVTLTDKDGTLENEGNPFEHLRNLLKQFSILNTDESIPFQCGAVGYLGYDLCHFIERLPDKALDDIGLPDMYMAFYDTIICYDNHLGKCSVIGVDFGLDSAIRDRMEQIAGSLSWKNRRRHPNR